TDDYLLPHAEEIDRSDRLPHDVRPRLVEAGFLSVGLPVQYGGKVGDHRAVAAVIEELARGSAAVATLVSVHLSVCAQPIATWGTPEQKDRCLRPLAEGRWLGAFALTEPGAGSDAAALACRFTTEPSGYRLTGSKMFITNAASADVVLTFARPAQGSATDRISCFILRKGAKGFSIAQRLDKLGLHGSETNEVVLQDAVVPSNDLLGPEGQGLSIALGALSGGRVGIASAALGVAQAAYDELETAVRASPEEWKRHALARAYVRLSAARALVERAADRKDAGVPSVPESSAAKLLASEAAVWIAGRAIEVIGQPAARTGSRPERLLRDARVFPIVEGTTEIQELILGRTLAGVDPA
ncbi:MAG: acyl-CoA dehydrogenase family protein, partial [Thermoplasmata archaeon]|nr:acyl-CoA dehydrogenase family protein [Thermoplasmata archaeon]